MNNSRQDGTNSRSVLALKTREPPKSDSLEDHAPEHLRQRVVRGGSLMVATRLFVQLLTLLATFFVIRLLSPSDFGLMAIALIFVTFAEILTNAGLGAALVQKKHLAQTDMGSAFTLNLLLSVVLYLTLWVVSAPVATYFGTPDIASLLRFIGLILFLVPLQVIAEASLKRELRLGTLSIIQAVALLVQSGVLLVLAFRGYGVWALAWSYVCWRITQTLLYWYASGWRPVLRKPSTDSLPLVRFGLTISASALVWDLYANADETVIAVLLGPTFVGIYSIAMLIISFPTEKISNIANQIVFVAFCKLQSDMRRMRSWFIRLLVLRLMFACPALIGVALVADDAVPLMLGVKWQSAVIPVQLLAPAGVFMIVSAAFGPFFYAIGRPDIRLKYDCACAATLPIAFFVACKFFGLAGVCFVWLTLYPLLITVMIQSTRKVTTVSVADLMQATAPVLLGTFFMGISVVGIEYLLPDTVPPFLRLAALITGGILSYSAWILTFARETILADIMVIWGELRWRRSATPEVVPQAAREAAP